MCVRRQIFKIVKFEENTFRGILLTHLIWALLDVQLVPLASLYQNLIFGMKWKLVIYKEFALKLTPLSLRVSLSVTYKWAHLTEQALVNIFIEK